MLVAGCGTLTDTGVEKITTSAAAFYRFGPAQAAPADKLDAEQRVMELQCDSGFSIVKTDDGKIGWVDSTRLKIAPPVPAPPKEETLEIDVDLPQDPVEELDLITPVDIIPSDLPVLDET